MLQSFYTGISVFGIIQSLWNLEGISVVLLPGHLSKFQSDYYSKNGRHFPDDIFKCIFLNENIWVSITISRIVILRVQLHQPRLWFITGGYLVKRWFLPAATRARGQSNDLNREILASNLFNCHKEVINAPPVPSISRCIHIVYRHKNVWEYQWSTFIYNCLSTFLHYVFLQRCPPRLQRPWWWKERITNQGWWN